MEENLDLLPSYGMTLYDDLSINQGICKIDKANDIHVEAKEYADLLSICLAVLASCKLRKGAFWRRFGIEMSELRDARVKTKNDNTGENKEQQRILNNYEDELMQSIAPITAREEQISREVLWLYGMPLRK